MNVNADHNADIVVTELQATGHLIPTADKTLVLSHCAGVGCSNCKRKIPVQRYKRYITQWVPLEKSVEIAARETENV